MSVRKWLVRGLVFSILGGLGCAAWLYQYWTNPTAVRQHVLDKLQALFPGAVVTLDSAHLRILGGISISELRLSSRSDQANGDVVHIPAGVIYHDKERLLDGVLSIRKVELQRPRVRVVRQSDGAWNIEGLTGPSTGAQETIPTIVIHQGTLVIEDRQGSAHLPSIEINNVSLTLVNDPVSVITVEGTAVSDTLGTLQISGTLNRTTHEAKITAKAMGVAISRALVNRAGSACPSMGCQQLHLEGVANIRADVTFQPKAPEPLSYDVSCQLSRGKLQHPQLCLPLEDLTAVLHLRNGHVTLERLDARAGMTLLQVQGNGQLPCLDQNFEAVVDIKHLHVNDELIERLPEKLQALGHTFRPVGAVGARIECARRNGEWVPLASGAVPRVMLLPENLQVTFQKFAYPLERMTGIVDFNIQSGHVKVDATAYTGKQPITIKGFWKGKNEQVDCTFDIQASDVPLDDKLLGALSGPMQKVAQSFHPQGKADIKAHIRHVPGTPAWQYHQEYHAHFHDLSICWQEFPYPLERMKGVLEIYPHHWRFDVQGSHEGGEVAVVGQSTSAAEGSAHKGMLVKITGTNVAMDKDLRKALEPLPSLARTWDAFVPSGRMSINATIERPPGPGSAEGSILAGLKYHFIGGGFTLKPQFLPYSLDEVRGDLRYHDGHVEISGLSARHGSTQVTLDKTAVDLLPGGGYYAKLNDFRAYSLYFDDDLIKALPSSLGRSCAALNLKEPIGLASQVIISQSPEPGTSPTLWWEGGVRFENAALTTGLEWTKLNGTLACRGLYQSRQLKGLVGNFKIDRGTILRQPFHDIQAHFEVKDTAPDELHVNVISAPLFGGDISGPIRFNFGSSPSYELNLTASQINLEEFGKHNLGPQSHLQGRAAGRLHLIGQGGRSETLDGNGSIDIPNGKLYNLPLLLDLLKFLGWRLPDRTAFDEAKAIFAIRGRRVRMEHLELVGNAVSLYGKGDFLIDGTDLQLDFYPAWGRIQQLVPPVMRGIPAEIGKNMLKIEMRGKVTSNSDDLKFTKKPMPVLLDPLYQIRERLLGDPERRRLDRNRLEIEGMKE